MMEDKEMLPENQKETQDGVQEKPELKSEEKTEDQKDDQEAVAEEPSTPEVEQPAKEPESKAEESGETPEPKKENSESSSHAQTAVTEDNEDSSTEDDEEEDNTSEEEQLLEELEFENPTKEELYEALKKFRPVENMRVVDKALKTVKPLYEKLFDSEKEAAKEAFVSEGNDAGDFDFKGEEIDHDFFELAEQLRIKKQAFFNQLEKTKEENYQRKTQLLEQLRELVDGEESTTSINALKSLQEEWRKIGQVPGKHAKTLWANYHALIDRFYDHRSIYFELKELDRKKNFEAKQELCEKAEALDTEPNIKQAIFQLNELHEEYKHIGPVPKEDQEPLWQRFKAASDNIYAKRRAYFDELKKDLKENLEAKQQLGDQAAEFASFSSDRISDWNKKTKALLELQKKWEAIGGLPRDKAKQINKHFWSNFKQFFANKNQFFKSLEGQKEENYKKKLELVEKANSLKDSEDWEKTANELKRLQNNWREIGPVPDKFRNEVYKKFKTACDHFFDRKRAQGEVKNQEFAENLKKKHTICDQIEEQIKSDELDLDKVYQLLEDYAAIGFVPRNDIKKIHKRFDEVTDALLGVEELSDKQRNELDLQIQMSKLKNSPHGGQKIQRKEGAIKRKISAIESDIATYKTNMGFFADSKNADKLKKDFEQKIAEAKKEMETLKKQLKLLNEL